MVIVLSDNRVKDVAAYMPLAKAFAEDTKTEKGCIEMNVGVDHKVPGRVIFVSKWETKEDFMNSIDGPAFQKHIPMMGQYYISGQDIFLEEC